MNNFFFEALKKLDECKYKDVCGLYSNTSYTCTHIGGSYCGQFRRLSKNPIPHTERDLIVISR